MSQMKLMQDCVTDYCQQAGPAVVLGIVQEFMERQATACGQMPEGAEVACQWSEAADLVGDAIELIEE